MPDLHPKNIRWPLARFLAVFALGCPCPYCASTTFVCQVNCCPNWRAWKGQNWDSLDRLHQRGYISDPATKAKSVLLTEKGAKRSQVLFEKHFMKDRKSTRLNSSHR